MSAHSRPPLAIFDVCGTLFRDDTTLGFLFYLSRKTSRLRWYLLNLLFHQRSPGLYALMILERLTGQHFGKHLAIHQLSGLPVEMVEREAEAYVDYLLARRVQKEIFPLFTRSLETGQTILASASLEPVVRALARRFQVDYVASSLQVSDGFYTGRLLNDMTGKKLAELQLRLGSEWTNRERHCFTDNFSDLELCQNCAHRTVVLLKPKHRRRWGSLTANYIEVARSC